ncbi:MAG: carboxypeptidase-like regulatory domain-containing protein [Gemmatimonadota bacterium]|nr:carboxypeptidase-like regulatory domain-containing protein [Gemmatimonadota bacterium]
MRQWVWILTTAVAAATACARRVPAQGIEADLRVRVESIDGARLPGALVALIDSTHRVVREGVSDEAGVRSLRAPPGSYRIRVRRIGFLPFLSEPVSVSHGSEIELRVESSRVLLETIVVTSRSKCGRIDPSERVLTMVWDEIAKALRASQLSARDFADYLQAFVYRKQLNLHGFVVSSDTTFRAVGNARPFGARHPAALVAHGYVVGNEQLGWIYYAPDETVLLSEEFAATHCFQVVRNKSRPGQVGIEFKPVSSRTVPEVAGILWVDQSTAELRELIFRFVNAGLLERFNAGGFARFRRLESGSWIVDDWALRAPILEKGRDLSQGARAIGYVEDGGGLTMRRKP